MRSAKVKTIAGFELVSTIRRPAYLITTFGMPVFLLLYAAFGMLIVSAAQKSEKRKKIYGVVDLAGTLALAGDTSASTLALPSEAMSVLEATGADKAIESAGEELSATFRPFPTEDAARAALLDGELTAYYRLGTDYLETGRANVFFSENAEWKERGARGSLERLLRETLLGRHLEAGLARRVARPIDRADAWTVTAGGEVVRRERGGQIAAVVIPVGFAALLFISLAMSTGYLMQGTAAEKENKVVDVLLAAAGPDEILFGKLLGLGGAGLLQISVWFGMVVVAGYFFAATIASLGIAVPWLALVVAPPFFAVAYFFIGSLILGTGSLGKNLKEVQQLGMVWSLASATPLMFMSILITDPSGTLSRVMTWIPFTAPVTVILRLALEPEGIAWWEIGGALAMMVVSTWIALKLGARLFRIGLLLTGSRPKWREILRQARIGA